MKKLLVIILALLLVLAFSVTALAAEREWVEIVCDGQPLVGVRNLVESAYGGFWVCTTGGLYLADQRGEAERMFSGVLKTQWVYDIAEAADGSYWLTQGYTYAPTGKNYGVFHISADGELIEEFNMENSRLLGDFAQAIEITADGRVWIGGDGGLSVYDPAAGAWKTYGKDDGLPTDSVCVLAADDFGGMWIGCYPNGEQGGLKPPFSGGYAYISKAGRLTAWAYDAASDDEYNSHLLGDFWVRSIAPLNDLGAGQAAISRSGAAPSYFESAGYVGADGLPIPISECVGGRLDMVRGSVVEHTTGRESIPAIAAGIIAGDPTAGTAGATPEIRALAYDEGQSLWLGCSALGLFNDKEDVNYSSAAGTWSGALYDNIYALLLTDGGTLIAGSQGGVMLSAGSDFYLPVAPVDIAEVRISSHAMTVNGAEAKVSAYLINGNNYFKLRDIAMLLNGSEAQFEVEWDAALAAINATDGAAYTAVGGELAALAAPKSVAPSTHKLFMDGARIYPAAYLIDGNNYYKLRDIGRLIDFAIGWQAAGESNTAAGTIIIDTASSYIGE